MLMDLGPDDTVIVPSFTFTTSALAFARQGARLLFCDIEPRTLGIDPEHLAELLDDSVRAVVLVHYAGIACDVAGVRKVLEPTGPTSPSSRTPRTRCSDAGPASPSAAWAGWPA